jgi:predicted secreted protein
MTWISYFAVYFIIWWLVLFATLPFSMRTQDEDENVTLGTVSSAPSGRHMLRAVIRTTLVATLIFAALYVLTRVLGYSIDDLPRIAPEID